MNHCVSEQFTIKTVSWIPMRKPYAAYFSEYDLGRLTASSAQYEDIYRTIVVCAFENNLVTCGGLSSVMRYLPAAFGALGERVNIVTPLYCNHRAVKSAIASGVLSKLFTVSFSIHGFSAEAVCYHQIDQSIPIFHIGVENFFLAEKDPYSYSHQTDLVDDSFAFCAAVPAVLNALNLKDNLLFHMHDWETAPIAYTVKQSLLTSTLRSAKCLLTLHNSYDKSLNGSIFTKHIPCCNNKQTILQFSIPLLDGPLTTVSEPFAREMMHDPLQLSSFTNHLQSLFSRNAPIGINNGLFGNVEDCVFGFESQKIAYDLVIKKKQKLRNHLVKYLNNISCSDAIGAILFANENKNVPILFASGRFDLNQKGFDILFNAFRRLPRGSMKLLFSPSSLDSSECAFFESVTRECAGDICILPYRIPKSEYDLFVRGASFLVMPSIYEPFGAATEGYLSGTPVIARATGGLWTQVTPWEPKLVRPAFYGSGNNHIFNSSGIESDTGILFRELFDDKEAYSQWPELLAYSVYERQSVPLYRAIVEANYNGLVHALDLFSDKQSYAKIILNGVVKLSQFSWKQTAEYYKHVFNCVSRSI